MALVVEDGTGITGANTYETLANVETYCEERGLTDWTNSADDDAKEQAILRGMDYLESLSYKGDKADYANELEWPRVGWYSDVAYGTIEYTTGAYDQDIPDRLKRALCRAAYEEFLVPGCLQVTLSKADYIKRQKVDVIETEYFDGAELAATPTYQVVIGHLKGLLRGGATTVRRT
jgi:hypothetical protein